MKTPRLTALLIVVWLVSPAVAAQRPLRPSDDRFRQPEPRRKPVVLTHVPSAAGGERGIAVSVTPPFRPRYRDGAPVLIHVPGGVSRGAVGGRPEFAGLGFVEIRFAFPGGGQGDEKSGGTYDYRGPSCLRALADVIRFATGRLADRADHRIQELFPEMPLRAGEVGLLGSSHGGNACGSVMATHGTEFPDLAFYASMESPYGEGNVSVELGAREQPLNPAYDARTGVLDLSKVAWSSDLPPGVPRRGQSPTETGADLKGALFFDLNGDGRFTASADYPANVFVQDLGQGRMAWYSPRLIAEAERRKLVPTPPPAHVPTLAEATEYWRWRDAAGSIAAAVRNCPQVAVMVYANQRDHVQAAPDHPHILAQVEGFRKAQAKFVRLNPDRAYVERILASALPPPNAPRPTTFPDNDAGTAWDRSNIRDGLEPDGLPITRYMQAAVCELADRVHTRNWAKNVDAVLCPDSPWTPVLRRPADADEPRVPPRNADDGRPALQETVPADAGSAQAPLLFCLGLHVEPLGATVSELIQDESDDLPGARTRPPLALAKRGQLPRPSPSYERALFFRHVDDVQTVAKLVQRHGGKLCVQAQTPFTRRLFQLQHPLFADLQRHGHEVALHFHEHAHLGPQWATLPVETWTAVFAEEIQWLRRAGASPVRYFSGGNLYPGVLAAASRAGLEVMSDYKNFRTQRDEPALMGVHPWRPTEGPRDADVTGFARHDKAGKIVFLPCGLFERTDHSAMRRSAEPGGDYAYFDALTRGLVLSLRAARPDRVNVFHITVHAGEFAGEPGTPRQFAVIDDWLGKIVASLVQAGKVRWATFSQMADAFQAWERTHPDAPPRRTDF